MGKPLSVPTSEELRLCQLHRAKVIDLRKPTGYRPGSESKVAVMAARYKLGLPIFAEGDNGGSSRLIDSATRRCDRATHSECEMHGVDE